MVCCNCLPNRERQPTAVARTGSHNRNATTLTDITWHVGVGYALFRQIIFLTNALQIGCAMSLVAAVVQQSSSDVGEWLGTTVYLIIMAVAGTILLTALLGCTGSCYQSQVTLIVVCNLLRRNRLRICMLNNVWSNPDNFRQPPRCNEHPCTI